jgi:hypothetical protein
MDGKMIKIKATIRSDKNGVMYIGLIKSATTYVGEYEDGDKYNLNLPIMISNATFSFDKYYREIEIIGEDSSIFDLSEFDVKYEPSFKLLNKESELSCSYLYINWDGSVYTEISN